MLRETPAVISIPSLSLLANSRILVTGGGGFLGSHLVERLEGIPGCTVFDTIRTPNRPHAWVAGGALVFLALGLTVPPLRALFSFAALAPGTLALAVGAAFASLAVAGVARKWKAARPPGRSPAV